MGLAGSPYPFARSTGRCAATGVAFTEGELLVAALVERDGQPGMERVDYSVAAWEGGQRPQMPMRLFGFWRGSYRAGDMKRQPLLGDAELLDLFEELGAATEPRQLTFRYLLTLLLVRRRVLRVVGTKTGVMMVVPRGEPEREPMAVVDPGLDDQAIADAIEQLGQVVATDSPQVTEPKPSQGRSSMMKTTCAWALVAACAVLALGGCCHDQKKDDGGVIARGAVPAYASVAEKYNARVVRLERLACPASVVVHYKDGKGNPLSEQVEANVQVALPGSVAVRLDKVGQTVFYLGSNDTRYWWFDLTDEKTALVGLHEKATPEAVASFGLPVHPLDLLEVFAIKPIPGAGTEQATHAALAWSKDGHYLGLTLPGRWGGQRRFWLDAETFDPVRVELLDKRGVVAVSAALSRYVAVDVDGDTTVHPRMASDFQVDLPLQQAKVSLRLAGPQNPGESQKAKLFDVDALLKYYKIQKVYDIDAPKGSHQSGTSSQN